MFCIDFEDELGLVGQGVDRPWVYNDGVIVTSDNCPQGTRCGYFDGGRLEVSFFSNKYASIGAFVITFHYKMTSGSSSSQGLISNDCFEGLSGEPGNSLYASCGNSSVDVGLKAPTASLSGVSTRWTSVTHTRSQARTSTHTPHTHSFRRWTKGSGGRTSASLEISYEWGVIRLSSKPYFICCNHQWFKIR